MANLHYHRWNQQFTIDTFSSEDSMRDYLSSNPTLIFEENALTVSIEEEKCLPKSTLGKRFGRADIILCRTANDTLDIINNSNSNPVHIPNVEAWIIELKKDEASYKNGFKQLFDYMTVVKNSSDIQKSIKTLVKRNIEGKVNKKDLDIIIDDPIAICGALIAPSFDLVGRTIESVKIYGKDWEAFEENLKKSSKYEEGFTLFDTVEGTRKLFSQICLIKLIRFRRGDEIIIYSENALGSKAAVQISRVDPVDLFSKGIINEADQFYFRDDNNKDHQEVKCKILNARGPSHSFKVRIESIKDEYELDMPKFIKDKYVYNTKNIPIEDTSKNCSTALHKLYRIYDDAKLHDYYWNFGDSNFVREHDKKSLSDLRERERA